MEGYIISGINNETHISTFNDQTGLIPNDHLVKLISGSDRVWIQQQGGGSSDLGDLQGIGEASTLQKEWEPWLVRDPFSPLMQLTETLLSSMVSALNLSQKKAQKRLRSMVSYWTPRKKCLGSPTLPHIINEVDLFN